MRKAAAYDFFAFCKYVIRSRDKDNNDFLSPEVHQPLCSLLEDETVKKKLILLPRGTFKSTIATINYPIWRLIRNPNLRILLDGETFGNTCKFLTAIKGIFEGATDDAKWFRKLYGNYVSKDKWKEDEIIISKRQKNFKEPTISCGSVDVVKVGNHYDIIVMDDLHSEQNTQTKEQIDKVINHFKLSFSLLEPGGMIICIGTRWHYLDLYGHIKETLGDSFKVYEEKAIRDDGSLFFPQRLTHKFLAEQKELQGSYHFSTQYQNCPIAIDDMEFKPAWKRYYDTLPTNSRRTMTLDPAIATKKRSDFFGVSICDIDVHRKIYVYKAIRLKLEPEKIIEKIFDLYFLYKPNVIGVEAVAFQKLFKLLFKLYEKTYEEKNGISIHLPILELKTNTRISKKLRIMRLQPLFENGTIYLNKGLDDLEGELDTFPKSKHDDLLDSLAYQLDFTNAPFKNEETEKAPAGSFAAMRQEMINKNRPIGDFVGV